MKVTKTHQLVLKSEVNNEQTVTCIEPNDAEVQVTTQAETHTDAEVQVTTQAETHTDDDERCEPW